MSANADQGLPRKRDTLKMSAKNRESGALASVKIPPRGVEVSSETPGMRGFLPPGGPKSGPSNSADATVVDDPALALLASAWPSLSLADRKAILAIVRRAAAHSGNP
jgi:hypothetical protein